MNGLLDAFEIDGKKGPPPFRPVARYFAPMDCLVYLREDCSYRAVRLTEYVTVLLDPQEDTAVGVKIKGTRHVIERHLAILRGAGMKITEGTAMRMLGIAETALSLDGEVVLAQADDLRRRYVPDVKRLAEEAGGIKPREVNLPLAA